MVNFKKLRIIATYVTVSSSLILFTNQNVVSATDINASSANYLNVNNINTQVEQVYIDGKIINDDALFTSYANNNKADMTFSIDKFDVGSIDPVKYLSGTAAPGTDFVVKLQYDNIGEDFDFVNVTTDANGFWGFNIVRDDFKLAYFLGEEKTGNIGFVTVLNHITELAPPKVIINPYKLNDPFITGVVSNNEFTDFLQPELYGTYLDVMVNYSNFIERNIFPSAYLTAIINEDLTWYIDVSTLPFPLLPGDVIVASAMNANYGAGNNNSYYTVIPTFPENPTTEAPTTEAPTTETPTTETPTTETPTTEAPTTETPTTEAPTTEAPTTEAPTTEAPTTETPSTELPTTETPITETPTTETPTTETPTTEAPTTETPITEAPTTETPTTEAPSTEVPTTEAPTTEAPTTETPTTEAPTTEAPTTEIPSTEAPTTETPTTEAPTTELPTTEMLTTEIPTTEASAIVTSSSEQSTPMKPAVPNKQSEPNAPVNNIKGTPSETSLPDTGETALNTGLISLIFAAVGGLVLISARRKEEMK
ncbi:hypothetical protein BFS35_010680 [Macrococcoides goetzii]|uniref:Gram-positive cocci surface proteins LPxTG domain-containing protein n=1 Tax=Macrococcoides goetzii TaxID=1891097 RepID=A0A395G7C4_9STAP|nr:LPXTG cell wall anchor domain-containing protein [Macrococcus goetzii]RAI79912.1 hypothetical protein BFS35_010680 [Macrococcus goetzii]